MSKKKKKKKKKKRTARKKIKKAPRETHLVHVKLDFIVDTGRVTTEFPHELHALRSRNGVMDFIFGGLSATTDWNLELGVITLKTKCTAEPIWDKRRA